MKVLKWILIVLVLLIALFVAMGYMLPREVVVSTTEKINLPPQKVFHFIAGFVERTSWDPWIKADTAAKCEFDIQGDYVGSRYTWEGPKVGKGMMEVDSVVFGSYLLNSVTFSSGEPIPEEWTFTPAEGGTDLTWTIKMRSDNPLGRIMNSMFKGMIQKTIDSGKADLKNHLETHGVTMSTLTEIGIDDFPAAEALVISGTGKIEEVSAMLGEYYGKIYAALQAQKLQPQGMPFALYTGYDPSTGICTMTAGMPVSSGGKSAGEVKLAKFPAFRAVKGLHTGPYDDVMGSYEAIEKYATENNISLTWDAWEFYLNDPSEVKNPTLLQTLIAMPVKK